MSFKKAVKFQAKLRLAIGGPAGTGKTYSSLEIGSEMARLIRESGHGPGKIALLDSERGSASLYADRFEFDVCEIDSYSPLTYVEKIKEAEAAGYDIIIIDSLSHAWAGKDGALEQKDRAAETKGNSFTAWSGVTPKQNALVDAIVGSKAHVIATMRQKTEFVQDKAASGKTEIRKVGLAFVQRDQIEFEFTLVGEIDHEHTMKISKTRVDSIDLGALFEKPGKAFANKLYTWLTSGAKPIAVSPAPTKPEPVAAAVDSAFADYLAAMQLTTSQAELDKVATGAGSPAKGTANYARAKDAYLKQKALIDSRAQTETQTEGAA